MSNRIDAVNRIVEYAQSISFDHLNDQTVKALKVFTLDSFGVGISGSRVPAALPFLNIVQQWGKGEEATVWNTGEKLPTASAAMLNAWQIHNQEFDCIHEKAVVHPMAIILPSLLAFAERKPKLGIKGKDLLVAIHLAVDIATLLGEASLSPLRFFRPAVCSAIGATIGLAKLAKLNSIQMKNAFGLIYSQVSGTMQAHTEGSPMLAMQMAINARSALNALDMAEANFEAPHDVLEGPFGLYTLFEPEHDLEHTIEKLGNEAQILKVSHKPFPTGRACHGGLDALMQLIELHNVKADDIQSGILIAPPLIGHLTGREPNQEMSAAYARLCFPYSAASYLLDGDVGVDCYDETKLHSKERIALAKRFQVTVSDCSDPNAMVPQTLELELVDGRVLKQSCNATLGSPERPLSNEQHIEKFRRSCKHAAKPMKDNAIDSLIAAVDTLDQLQDLSVLSQLTTQTECAK